ncbi:MAG: hypothetical protein A2Y62_18885 [Candidatus Fischerbacteria bacterium RBG_13_37_8]|uniref:4Fe-4S ferredoxin-type domain-containing protein n=1 Tax=Candidatus Fischerbacteria bacterium RBG_13_37_8 TaxID=1817863 RepID=A0A1F5VXX1_9BACT|nr:MAG: hypothetical protein A2Y62_18885 [Candidatus Fischerbacteria bacterium RBG_13_37_8]
MLTERCYQCGKCAAGCPLADEMDYPSTVIMRMLQLGLPEMDDKVLQSYTIWLCLTCETCYARCPMEIDIPRVMDYLRGESLRLRKVNRRAKDILAFNKSFLDTIKHTGRLYEFGLIADYKIRSFHWFQDVLLAPVMYIKGKLGFLPHRIKGTDAVARIFEKSTQKEEKQ